MPGGSVSVGDSFICYVINKSGGSISYSQGSSGSTLATFITSDDHANQSNNKIGKLEFIFTDATNGSEKYSAILYIDNS